MDAATETPRGPTLARALGAGLLSGLLGGVAGNFAHVVASSPRGLHFLQFSPSRVFAGAVAINLLVGALWRWLALKPHAQRILAVSCAGAAVISALGTPAEGIPGLTSTAVVVHLSVAAVAAYVVPRASLPR